MKKTISCCLIVKDEENHIMRCLESIKDIADEIIVVDTGSTDRTIEISEKMGARIYYYKWENDFSKARNFSIEKASMDWIMFIDADEELKKGDCVKVRELIEDNQQEGFYIKVVNIVAGNPVYEAASLRLFKNNPLYRFKGKLHEQIIHSIKEFTEIDRLKETDIVFYHYGYDEKLSDLEKKNKRNIEILLSYDEEDKDSYYYFVLGNEYGKIGEHKKALDTYIKSIDSMELDKYQYAYYPSLIMNIVKILNNENRYIDMISFIKKIEETTPNYRDLYFMECLGWMQCGKYTRSRECLEKYINCKTKQNYDYPLNHFELQYDINLMKSKLENLSINKSDDRLSVLIIINKVHENLNNNLVETIKSVNEITENIVVVVNEDVFIDIERVLNVRAQIIQVPKELSRRKRAIGKDACKCDYIMFIDDGQLLSPQINKNIVKMLENNIIDKIEDTNGNNLKIVKNDDSVFIFEEYTPYLNNFGDAKIEEGKIKYIYKGLKFEFTQLNQLEDFNDVFLKNKHDINIDEECILIDIGDNSRNSTLLFALNPKIKMIYSYEILSAKDNYLANSLTINPSLNEKVKYYNYGLEEGNKLEIINIEDILIERIRENISLNIILKIESENFEKNIFNDEKIIEQLKHIKEVIITAHSPLMFVNICNILKRHKFDVQGKMISKSKGYIKARKNCG